MKAKTGNQNELNLEKVLTTIFIALTLIFLAGAIYLAAINGSSGMSPDAKNNLDTARNILNGEGFTSHVVLQHFVRQSLPNPEVVRSPGVPYMLAGLWKIFGMNLSIPILLNMLSLILAAWFMRFAIVFLNGKWFGSLAGILMLLSSNYELVSILNNDFLVLSTCALILTVTCYMNRGLHPVLFAVLSALICVFGFYMKPTFILAAIPVMAFVFFFPTNSKSISLRNRYSMFTVFLIIFAIFISPFFIRIWFPLESR